MKKYFLILLLGIAIVSLKALTLSECVNLAKENNKTIKKAREEVKKYKESYKDVKGNLLPQLNLSGGYQYEYKKLPNALIPEIPSLSMMLTPQSTPDDQIIAGYIDGAFTNLIPEQTTKTYNLAGKLKLNQVIFMGGKLINGINIAGKLYHLQEKKYFLTEQDIIYQTIDMFYKCILANEVVKIQKEAYQVATKHFNVVKTMYEQGLVSEYDFLRAKLEKEKIVPQIYEAEKNRDLITESFAKFLNIDKKNLKLEGSIKMPKIKEISLKEALKIGLKNRMELKLAKIGVEVSKVQLRYQKGNFLPNIGLNAEYDYYGSTENSFKKDNFGNSYQVGIGFSMPLFTGFSNRAKISKARHQLKQSELDFSNLKDMIELDITNSFKQLQKDRVAVNVQKSNLELSQKALKIAEKRYENQLSDQLEVFDAQIQNKASRLAYLQSVYQVITDYQKFKKSIGKNLYKEVKNEK